MAYEIRTYTRIVSYRDEDGEWMDSDYREIEPVRTDTYRFDEIDALEFDTPGEWAIEFMHKNIWATSASRMPVGQQIGPQEWLMRQSEHPYRDETEEVSVYLWGDWTPQERARVFTAALGTP